MSARDIHFFFTARNQIKLYHWQTSVYSRHKATDEIVTKLDEHIDKYVEVYAGKYGRSRLNASTNRVELVNMSEGSIVKFVKNCIIYLQGDLVRRLGDRDTDLVNIRDEMVADLNQLLYLFTLK
jgi:hypothetical protein